jgi:hypothetical protein
MGLPPHGIDVIEVVERLRHAKRRIIQTVTWARAATEVWTVFNEFEDRMTVAHSPAQEAAHVYERSSLDARIVMLTRVLDQPGRGRIMGQNRLSLPVCRTLLALPGVMDWLTQDADDWDFLDNRRGPAVRERYPVFLDRLTRIENETDPNRAQLLRDFRDENIAHELRFDRLRARPEYQHLRTLLADVQALTEDLAMIVQGERVVWRDGDVTRSANALWQAVADRYRDDEPA